MIQLTQMIGTETIISLNAQQGVFCISCMGEDFKPLEFEGFRKQAGLNAFTLSYNLQKVKIDE